MSEIVENGGPAGVNRAIRVTVNGEKREVVAATTVAGLLEQLGLDPTRVAVERNLEIVSRARHGETVLSEGDSLEIVHFVGGGEREGKRHERSTGDCRPGFSVPPDGGHREVSE